MKLPERADRLSSNIVLFAEFSKRVVEKWASLGRR